MSDTSTTPRPLPIAYRSSEPYWSATAQGRLDLQRCEAGHIQFYPRAHCHRCGTDQLDWFTTSGRGTLHTFSVVHRAGHDGFADRLPYVFAIVDLEERARLTANIVDVDPGEIHIGMKLRAVFTDRDGGYTLPQFAPQR